jgi:hypothetical protein
MQLSPRGRGLSQSSTRSDLTSLCCFATAHLSQSKPAQATRQDSKNVGKRVANQRKQDIEKISDKDLYCTKRSMLSSDMQRGLQSRHINHIDVRY